MKNNFPKDEGLLQRSQRENERKISGVYVHAMANTVESN